MEKKVNSKLILSAVAACLMSTCAIAPFAMMSLYMEQMSQSINTTVGAIAIALSVSTVGSLVASLLVGKILKVLGHRIPIIIAGILIFAFQYTLSVSQSIVPIYIVAFFNGFGTVWGGIAMAQIIIAQWFKKGMGTMMSVCMVVMGIVLTVTIPLIGSIIATVGYRQIVLIVGIVGGAGVILSALLASGAPEKYGLKPYGAVETDADAEGAAALSPSLPFNKILKTTVFWAILLIVLLGTIVAQGFSSQAAVVFGTFGLDAGQAALAFGIFTFLGLPWQFTFGILCDKIGPKLSMTICAGICSVILLLAFLLTGFVGAIIFAFGVAAGGALSGLYGPNMAPRLFGVGDVGNIMGFVTMAASVGATIGPLFFGLMYDSFGNYTAVLLIMGIIMALCILVNFWLNNKKNLQKIQEQIARECAEPQQ